MSNANRFLAVLGHPVLFIPVFPIFVNLTCGWIAVEFHYPSLWAGGDVFKEYAYPLPTSWAITHWPSMLIVAVLLSRMSGWTHEKVTRYRRGFLVGIALCLAAEFAIGKGRFNEVPFLLFLMVDFATAYLFSLVLHEKRRPLVGFLQHLTLPISYQSPWQHLASGPNRSLTL
jgi:hypothetical protein